MNTLFLKPKTHNQKSKTVALFLALILLLQPILTVFADDPGYLPPAPLEDRLIETWAENGVRSEGDTPPPAAPLELPPSAQQLTDLIPSYLPHQTAQPQGDLQIALVPPSGSAISFLDNQLLILVPPRTFSSPTRLHLHTPTHTLFATALPSETPINTLPHPLYLLWDIRPLASRKHPPDQWRIAFSNPTSTLPNTYYPHTTNHHPQGIFSTPLTQLPLSFQMEQLPPSPTILNSDQPPGSWKFNWNPPTTATFSGAATYQHPIELPPGRNNFQPNLTLSYSSNALNMHISAPSDQGPLGLGFSLGDIAITRSKTSVGSTQAPGCPARFRLDLYDSYSLTLNGQNQELKFLSLSPDQTTATYIAINNPGLFIRQIHNPTLPNSNPDRLYWLVKTANGTTYRLGYTNDATKGQHNSLGNDPNGCPWGEFYDNSRLTGTDGG